MKKVISVVLVLVMVLAIGTVAISSVSAEATKVNGKSANIGDTVTINVYLQADKTLENFQGYFSYDSTILSLQKFEMPNIQGGGMYNKTFAGFVYHSGSSPDPLYDFTAEKVFAVITFKVLKAGDTNVTDTWEVMHDCNSVNLVDASGNLDSSVKVRLDVNVTATTTTSTTKPTTKPTTASTTKSTTATNPTSATNVTNTTKQDESTTQTTVAPTVKPVVKVTSVKLNATSKVLNKGRSFILKATVAPSNAASKAVSWSSTNKQVATVTQAGVVVAKKKGVAYIKATAKDGSKKSAQCKVTVKQPVTKVTVSVKSKTLKFNKSFSIKATVAPSNANNKNVGWTLNKKGIVKISKTTSASGKAIKVTALKKAGTVVLKATAKDGSKKYASCKIVVKKK